MVLSATLRRHSWLLLLLLLVLFCPQEGLCEKDLKVMKDKEGTTYTVGSDNSRKKAIDEEERDKERAWDMLRNTPIIMDNRR